MPIPSLLSCPRMLLLPLVFNQVRKLRANLAELNTASVCLSVNRWMTALTRGILLLLINFYKHFTKPLFFTFRSTVSMGIRVIQYAPSQQQGRQPCTIVRRDFVLSPGDLEMELNLDKQVTNIQYFKKCNTTANIKYLKPSSTTTVTPLQFTLQSKIAATRLWRKCELKSCSALTFAFSNMELTRHPFTPSILRKLSLFFNHIFYLLI